MLFGSSLRNIKDWLGSIYIHLGWVAGFFFAKMGQLGCHG